MNYENQNGLLVPCPAKLVVGGVFHCELFRKGELIDEWDSHNLIVNQGLDHVLRTEFTGSSQISQWYMAPFTNNYVPVGTDTAASFPGSAGETTAYTGSTRVAYTGVETGQQVTNAASPASFTFTADLSIYGAFLISSSAQGSTSGTLFAASQFAAPKAVANTDVLLMTYAIGAASA